MINIICTLMFALTLGLTHSSVHAGETPTPPPSKCQSAFEIVKTRSRQALYHIAYGMTFLQRAQFELFAKQLQWQVDHIERYRNGLTARLILLSARLDGYYAMLNRTTHEAMIRASQHDPFAPSVFDLVDAVAHTLRGVEARRDFNWTMFAKQAYRAEFESPGSKYDFNRLLRFEAPARNAPLMVITLDEPLLLFHDGHRRPRWHRKGESLLVEKGMVVEASTQSTTPQLPSEGK